MHPSHSLFLPSLPPPPPHPFTHDQIDRQGQQHLGLVKTPQGDETPFMPFAYQPHAIPSLIVIKKFELMWLAALKRTLTLANLANAEIQGDPDSPLVYPLAKNNGTGPR
ncbi:hypothetical protein CHUAL_004990 [Chamberlinius hualienensis]